MNTKRFQSFFLAVALMLSFQLISCKTGKRAVVEHQPLEKALLWKITGPNIDKPSYLFGTIHLIDSKDYFLPKGMMTAMDEVKKVVFEIDMKEMNDMSAIMSMMGKIMMKDDKTLKDLLSKEDYTTVSNFFQEMGLPMMMLERMKPMFLTVFASGDMDPGGLQSGTVKSYEMELMDMAESAGKSTGGLETIEFQLSLFDEIPYEAQAKMLVDAIKSRKDDDASSQMDEMVKMYINQDINGMVHAISEESDDVEGFEEKLLTKRNESWIPLIIAGAKAQPTLFAVGAGHLGGEKGVIRLLQKQGIKMTPISIK